MFFIRFGIPKEISNILSAAHHSSRFCIDYDNCKNFNDNKISFGMKNDEKKPTSQ